MYARGYEFMPVDLYKVEANRFQIVDGKLMPALSTIEGMGDECSGYCGGSSQKWPLPVQGRPAPAYQSLQKTVVDLMDDLGILGDLPESNQLSLFDFA